MPTYEYHCEKCDRNFEVTQSMKDDVLKTCPKDLCQRKTWGKGRVKRQIGSGAGLIFKGTGFYSTDYKKSGGSEAPSGTPAARDRKSACREKCCR